MKDYRKSKKSHDDLNKIKVPKGLQEKQDAKRPTVRNDVKLSIPGKREYINTHKGKNDVKLPNKARRQV